MLSNHFDCATSQYLTWAIALEPLIYCVRAAPMFEVVAAILVVLSIGILVAHAFDAYRS